MKILLTLTTALALTFAAYAAQDSQPTKPTGDAAAIQQQLPSYPSTVCLVSGEPMDETAKNVIHEGRLVRFCCGMCVKAFEKDPAPTLAKLDLAIVAAQKASYPLETCVISDEKLGSMGDPIEYIHGTRLVRLCCKGCVKTFEREPASHMQKVNTALIAKQKATYAPKTCPVSGNDLGDGAVDHLHGTRLVRLCCDDCVASFQKTPAPFLAKLDAAAKKMERPKQESGK